MENPTLQSLLKRHLPGIFKRHKFPLFQYKALTQLAACRTEALGGHKQTCEDGHVNGIWYNSCKNRSCPQCKGMATEEWLRNTRAALLDCPHHHIVFTFSSQLHPLWQYNRELFGDILFTAAQDTLKQFSKDPKYLNATPGILCALHTWGRAIPLHPHIHAIVSHGGLDDEGNWVEPKKKSLFPQKPVRIVFRGKLRAYLKEALEKDKLVLPPDRRKNQVLSLLNKLGREEHIVHFCERYDYGDGVAKYLARYVKGGPLNNSQILKVTDTHITFQYKSHLTKHVEKLTLTVDEFVLRYVQHIPVPGKPTVRYTGLYSSSMRKKLNIARISMGQKPMTKREQIDWKSYLEDKGDMPVCTVCGKPLLHSDEVPFKKLAA